MVAGTTTALNGNPGVIQIGTGEMNTRLFLRATWNNAPGQFMHVYSTHVLDPIPNEYDIIFTAQTATPNGRPAHTPFPITMSRGDAERFNSQLVRLAVSGNVHSVPVPLNGAVFPTAANWSTFNPNVTMDNANTPGVGIGVIPSNPTLTGNGALATAGNRRIEIPAGFHQGVSAFHLTATATHPEMTVPIFTTVPAESNLIHIVNPTYHVNIPAASQNQIRGRCLNNTLNFGGSTLTRTHHSGRTANVGSPGFQWTITTPNHNSTINAAGLLTIADGETNPSLDIALTGATGTIGNMPVTGSTTVYISNPSGAELIIPTVAGGTFVDPDTCTQWRVLNPNDGQGNALIMTQSVHHVGIRYNLTNVWTPFQNSNLRNAENGMLAWFADPNNIGPQVRSIAMNYRFQDDFGRPVARAAVGAGREVLAGGNAASDAINQRRAWTVAAPGMPEPFAISQSEVHRYGGMATNAIWWTRSHGGTGSNPNATTARTMTAAGAISRNTALSVATAGMRPAVWINVPERPAYHIEIYGFDFSQPLELVPDLAFELSAVLYQTVNGVTTVVEDAVLAWEFIDSQHAIVAGTTPNHAGIPGVIFISPNEFNTALNLRVRWANPRHGTMIVENSHNLIDIPQNSYEVHFFNSTAQPSGRPAWTPFPMTASRGDAHAEGLHAQLWRIPPAIAAGPPTQLSGATTFGITWEFTDSDGVPLPAGHGIMPAAGTTNNNNRRAGNSTLGFDPHIAPDDVHVLVTVTHPNLSIPQFRDTPNDRNRINMVDPTYTIRHSMAPSQYLDRCGWYSHFQLDAQAYLTHYSGRTQTVATASMWWDITTPNHSSQMSWNQANPTAWRILEVGTWEENYYLTVAPRWGAIHFDAPYLVGIRNPHGSANFNIPNTRMQNFVDPDTGVCWRVLVPDDGAGNALVITEYLQGGHVAHNPLANVFTPFEGSHIQGVMSEWYTENVGPTLASYARSFEFQDNAGNYVSRFMENGVTPRWGAGIEVDAGNAAAANNVLRAIARPSGIVGNGELFSLSISEANRYFLSIGERLATQYGVARNANTNLRWHLRSPIATALSACINSAGTVATSASATNCGAVNGVAGNLRHIRPAMWMQRPAETSDERPARPLPHYHINNIPTQPHTTFIDVDSPARTVWRILYPGTNPNSPNYGYALIITEGVHGTSPWNTVNVRTSFENSLVYTAIQNWLSNPTNVSPTFHAMMRSYAYQDYAGNPVDRDVAGAGIENTLTTAAATPWQLQAITRPTGGVGSAEAFALSLSEIHSYWAAPFNQNHLRMMASVPWHTRTHISGSAQIACIMNTGAFGNTNANCSSSGNLTTNIRHIRPAVWIRRTDINLP